MAVAVRVVVVDLDAVAVPVLDAMEGVGAALSVPVMEGVSEGVPVPVCVLV